MNHLQTRGSLVPPDAPPPLVAPASLARPNAPSHLVSAISANLRPLLTVKAGEPELINIIDILDFFV